MNPSHWILQWVDPATGQTHQSGPYYQRAQVRGAAIIKRAAGMADVTVIAKGF